MRNEVIKLILLIFSISIISYSCSLKTRTDNFSGKTELEKYCEKLKKTSKFESVIKGYELKNKYSLYVYYPEQVKLGDLVNIKVISPYEGYLYIYVINPKGKITLLFPNSIVPNNFLEKDTVFQSVNKKFLFVAQNPKGKHLVVLLFSKKEIKNTKVKNKQDLEELLRTVYENEKNNYIKLLYLDLI